MVPARSGARACDVERVSRSSWARRVRERSAESVGECADGAEHGRRERTGQALAVRELDPLTPTKSSKVPGYGVNTKIPLRVAHSVTVSLVRPLKLKDMNRSLESNMTSSDVRQLPQDLQTS